MIRAAVLGSPISHSLSPILHRTAYEYLGVQGQYDAIDVTAGQLSDFVRSLDKTWTGLSLTMPLKEEILSIADEVDGLALRINSANTLIRADSGWRALTTDVVGFTQTLSSHSIKDYSSVLILGAGATARAAAAACDSRDRKIYVLHRTIARESAMQKAAPLAQLQFLPWEGTLPDADLIVNTTPAHVADRFIDQLNASPHGVFFESLYYPWPTKLLAHWRALGGTGIDGLDLLIYQGMEQVALMTAMEFDRSALAPILREACISALKS